MSLFQRSVLKNITQDESIIALRWAKFQAFLAKKEFIQSVKEEKYQDGFLKDIFESCLGYTLYSTDPSDFNLEREKKNENDGKKADGAIYLNGEVVGIIELKAQDTKNLDKATDQAFGYLVSNSKAHYVIVSNFDELRFYIDKKTAFEKFSLFDLSNEEFKKLHLLLSYESIKESMEIKIAFSIFAVAQMMLSGNFKPYLFLNSIVSSFISSVILTISKFSNNRLSFFSSSLVILGNDSNSISVMIDIENVYFGNTIA